jgi:hypothetical protein
MQKDASSRNKARLFLAFTKVGNNYSGKWPTNLCGLRMKLRPLCQRRFLAWRQLLWSLSDVFRAIGLHLRSLLNKFSATIDNLPRQDLTIVVQKNTALFHRQSVY